MTGNGVKELVNPLGWNPNAAGPGIFLSDDNLIATYVTGTTDGAVKCTVGKTSGKWYFEAVILTASGTLGLSGNDVGIMSLGSPVNINVGAGTAFQGFGYSSYAAVSSKLNNSTSAPYGIVYGTVGDVIGVTFDFTTLQIGFYVNNVSQGIAYSSLSGTGTYYPAVSSYNKGAISYKGNFKSTSLVYTPPSGFSALG